jgi:hypothetical protein
MKNKEIVGLECAYVVRAPFPIVYIMDLAEVCLDVVNLVMDRVVEHVREVRRSQALRALRNLDGREAIISMDIANAPSPECGCVRCIRRDVF